MSLALQAIPPDGEVAAATQDVTGIDPAHGSMLLQWINSPNLALETDENGALYFGDAELSALGQKVVREYEIDDGSRSEWKQKYDKWMEFALQKALPKQYPWPKAANVIFPLMTTASVQFAARAYPAIIQNRNVVKGVVVGPDPDGLKRQRSQRIGDYMSWQLLDEMEDWEGDTDKLLHILPIVGCVFRKTYFDPSMQRPVSEMISALRVCVNYHAQSFERAPRVTEEVWLYPVEIEERIRSGVFVDHDYALGAAPQPGQDAADSDAPVMFLEQHRRVDLDGDGYAEPYIVTVDRVAGRVARIVAAYDADGVMFGQDGKIRRVVPNSYYTKYDFVPNFDGGVYGVGFGHLLYPINEAVNTTLNQLLDAGHLANTGGGFIGKGVSLSTGDVRFRPGEFKPVNVTGGSLRDNILPLPFPGPSPVLFQLLGLLIEAGKEVAAIKDILMGEQPAANVPATTVLALIEQGMQVFSSIYKRVHRSLKLEYTKLYRINKIYMDESSHYEVGDEWREISREDFVRGSGVKPVSDPTMVSDMQRLGRANFLLQFKDDPMMNGREIRKRVLDAALIEQPDALFNNQPPPVDPQIQLAQSQLQIEGMAGFAEARRKADRDRYENLKSATAAYLDLANAQKAVGQTHAAWIDTKLAILQAQIDAATSDNDPGAGSGGNQSPIAGANTAAMEPMAPPPG